MITIETEILLRPELAAHRFLPEGPQVAGPDTISWVSIQHGPESRFGSLNLLNMKTGQNKNIPLAGRPGFAFPQSAPNTFLIGLERCVGLFDTVTGKWDPVTDELEQGVEGTILNDGEPYADGVVFGAKDVNFKEKKAGLYLWQNSISKLTVIRTDQTCSNGKVITQDGHTLTVLDIDTPDRTVDRFTINLETAEATEREVVINLKSRDDYPDGMVATPDGKSVIIAFYNPNDVEFGVAEQFSLKTGEVEARWTTPKSPRVTCPLLLESDGKIQLVLTTAVEDMTEVQLEQHENAGSMFISETSF